MCSGRVEPGRRNFEVNPMELLLIITVVIVFEFAAARWAYDSRDGFRIRRR
jgi:hypothetical protein